ncbi:ribonuclease domain-containing protein [Streptomyces sp. NPDC093225]|uniref:ribonuclease domain-containing protein n=1 Tax=Streptomyces sp. NPDC093225 TaxID=3366034 RepID=UPI00382C2A43
MMKIVKRLSAVLAVTGVALASAATAHAEVTVKASPMARSAVHTLHMERGVRTAVPDQAWQTLALIDAGQWPPNDGSGTRGGDVWPNRDGVLPVADSEGNPIQYRQWDVNRRTPGQNRDAQRIVTGDDGSAWYAADLFGTFERMR